MTSFLLKITTLALICGMSLAGINLLAVESRYDNNAISMSSICDHKKPTYFLPEYKSNFNCTSFVALQNGSLVCNDNPCQFYRTFGPYVECSWQTFDAPSFLLPGPTTFNLFPCYKCPTHDCTGRYYKDYSACKSGKMTTSDYGVTWTCTDDTCKGQMKKQTDGTWICIDSTCSGAMVNLYSGWTCQESACSDPASMKYDSTNKRWECEDNRCYQDKGMVKTGSGWACASSECITPLVLKGNQWICLNPKTSSDSSLIPWAVVVLLSIAVLFLAYQLRSKAQTTQLNNQFMGVNGYN